MGILKNIYWRDEGKDKGLIVHKFDMQNDYVARGSALTVSESQVAVFCHKGKMADVFLPGFYKLDTSSVPVLTKLMSWKYGFENPFRSEIYFVSTKQFINQKWGTSNPIILRDKDYGAIRIRGFGTYSFKVDDAYIFMQELSGNNSSFSTQDVSDYLRSMLIMAITDALGESKLPVLEMAANLRELSKEVEKTLSEDFKKIGLELSRFNFENFSLPEELEKAFDKSASLGMMRDNMGTYMQMAQADALRDAAKNPGMAGTIMGAGIGFGAGRAMGDAFSPASYNTQTPEKNNSVECPSCHAKVRADVKFCPDCGKPMASLCPKCKAPVKSGAKFCAECGTPLVNSCPKCNAKVKAGAKFCPDCGEKL